jgi:hypothetical protein
VVIDRPFRDVFSAFENAEPARRAEAIDEYRELEMLAHAWEHGSLEERTEEDAPGPGPYVDLRVREAGSAQPLPVLRAGPPSVGNRNPDDLSETDRRSPKADIRDV